MFTTRYLINKREKYTTEMGWSMVILEWDDLTLSCSAAFFFEKKVCMCVGGLETLHTCWPIICLNGLKHAISAPVQLLIWENKYSYQTFRDLFYSTQQGPVSASFLQSSPRERHTNANWWYVYLAGVVGGTRKLWTVKYESITK